MMLNMFYQSPALALLKHAASFLDFLIEGFFLCVFFFFCSRCKDAEPDFNLHLSADSLHTPPDTEEALVTREMC